MAIKVGKKKAHISAGVEEIYKKCADIAMRNIYEQIHNSPNRIAARILEQKRGDIARLNDILNDTNKPGRGLDLELTRLRGIDFESIDTIEAGDEIWLVAQTRDLMIQTVTGMGGYTSTYSHSEKNKMGEIFDCGDYKIYVKIRDLGENNIQNLHFVPDLDPSTNNRHYHHRAFGPNVAHPTMMSISTCWGGFADPISSTMAAVDLPDLFRMLRIFVGRRNPKSLLVHRIDHEVRNEY